MLVLVRKESQLSTNLTMPRRPAVCKAVGIVGRRWRSAIQMLCCVTVHHTDSSRKTMLIVSLTDSLDKPHASKLLIRTLARRKGQRCGNLRSFAMHGIYVIPFARGVNLYQRLI